MSIPLEDAFDDLHNLGVKEAHRKYLPQFMLVAVDDNDCIIKTEKFKKVPELEELHGFGSDCQGTSIFVADTEGYPTLIAFRQRVKNSGEAIRRRRQGITDDPETYYPGRGLGKDNDMSGN